MLSLGVDLTSSSKRPSAYAVLDEQSALVNLDAFKTYLEFVAVIDEYKPSLIAIDAPLSLPLGLDCLEENCPRSCSPLLNHKGRMAELELARMGIGCFFTTKRSIIKKLVYRGLKFRKKLTEMGQCVIEVYPYATKVILFGDKIPRKNSPRGLLFMKEKLPVLIQGLEPGLDRLNHDKCDAVLAAYTAYLHQQGKTDILGNPEEGQIVVPKLC